MRPSWRALALVVALVLTPVAACGGDDDLATGGTASTPLDGPAATVPDRDPDVTGVVARTAGEDPTIGAASDAYFEGMALLRGDPVVVDAASGDELTAADVVDGAEVAVWVEGPCAESYPVQCTVVALRIGR